MNIVLNFIPLKQGGGVQIGLDFISNIGKLGKNHEWYLVCSDGTPFATCQLPENCKRVRSVAKNLFSRLYFEFVESGKLVKEVNADVIYTQFGPQWPTRQVPQVVGCAYSNLFYPEIDFWNGLSIIKKMERRIYDYVRRKKLQAADLVIFETPDLARRAVSQKILKKIHVSYVLPAVSGVADSSAKESGSPILRDFPGELKKKVAGKFSLCCVSSYAKHKNIETLVDVLVELKLRTGKIDIVFILTLPEQNSKVMAIMRRAEEFGVAEGILNIGPVSYTSCADVYHAADAAILLSSLESFSNNIAEAWKFGKPLVINDRSWSRTLCEDAAIYVDQKNPQKIAEELLQLKEDSIYYRGLVVAGRRRLAEYPVSEERYKQYVSLIEKTVNDFTHA